MAQARGATGQRRNVIDTGEADELWQLTQQLDADSADQAMDAQAELTHRGRHTDVVAPLLRALPALSRYGQLCAIEIVEELDDRRADQPLIALLTSEHDTVREWAAGALGRRRVHQALPILQRAYQTSIQRRDPPDWSEPVALRQALTDLGARHPIVPSLTASLQTTAPNDWPAWPSTRLVDVIDDLANNDQVTLYFALWRVEPDGRMYGTEYSRDETDLDFAQPWPDLVVQARNRAVGEARRAKVAAQVLATIEWIDRSDV